MISVTMHTKIQSYNVYDCLLAVQLFVSFILRLFSFVVKMSNVYTLLFSMLISRFFLVAQHCTKNVFYFNHVLGTCSLDDYCLASDQERLHTKFFSTKNAYQARQSHDGQNDFSLDSKKRASLSD